MIFDILSLVGLFGASWVGLAIKGVLSEMKNNQATVKADLVAAQTDMKEQLTARHSHISEELATHTARDEEQFKTVNKTLDRIESKIDRAANGH